MFCFPATFEQMRQSINRRKGEEKKERSLQVKRFHSTFLLYNILMQYSSPLENNWSCTNIINFNLQRSSVFLVFHGLY